MTLLLRHAALLPVEDRFIPDGFIRIDGARIAAMGPEPYRDEPYPPGQVWDAQGLVAMPGLINAHTHLSLTRYRGIADDVGLFDFLRETQKRWGKASPEEAFEACLEGCQAAVRSGTTCLVDTQPTSPRPAVETARRVGVRIAAAAAARSTWFGEPAPDTLAGILAETDRLLREGDAERAVGDRMYVPYLAAHSPYNCTAEQLRRVKALCRERGWIFAMHLSESADEVELVQRWTGLTPMAYAAQLGLLDARTVIAHGVHLSDEDIALLARSGAHLAHSPKSNAKLGNGVAPIPACLAAGVSVALGTDSMVSNNNLDMLEEMRFAALVHRAAGRDPAAVTARQVFEMATLGGARALGLAGEIGSLQPGKRADLVLLALQPPIGLTEDAVLSELVFHATADVVRAVTVNGRVVFDNGAGLPSSRAQGGS